MALNRREMLRLGAVGVAGTMVSSAAMGLPAMVFQTPPAPSADPVPAAPRAFHAPGGIDPRLFARAKAAFEQHRHQLSNRDVIGITDFSIGSRNPRFYIVDLLSGRVDSHFVAHGRGSDPGHSGYLHRFSNQFGSLATSNGSYATSDTYVGKYGLSMRVRGLDWTNSNAEARAIVIHQAWYAEPGMIDVHGKLGRSEGCFAFSRRSHWEVMHRLGQGRLIYADKVEA
jgi:hypothetical protein